MTKTNKILHCFIACVMSLVIVFQVTVPVFASSTVTVIATAVPYTFDILGEAYAIVEASDAVYAVESLLYSQSLASTFYATNTAASAVLSSAPAVDVALTSGGKVASLTSGGAIASGTAGAPVVVTTLKVVAFAAVLSWCAGLFFEGLNKVGIDLGSVSSEKLADILVGYLGSEQTTYEQWIATPVLLSDGTYSDPNEALVTLVGGKFVVSDHFLAKARSFVDWITDNVNEDGIISIGDERIFVCNNFLTSVTDEYLSCSFYAGSVLDYLTVYQNYSRSDFRSSPAFSTIYNKGVNVQDYFENLTSVSGSDLLAARGSTYFYTSGSYDDFNFGSNGALGSIVTVLLDHSSSSNSYLEEFQIAEFYSVGYNRFFYPHVSGDANSRYEFLNSSLPVSSPLSYNTFASSGSSGNALTFSRYGTYFVVCPTIDGVSYDLNYYNSLDDYLSVSFERLYSFAGSLLFDQFLDDSGYHMIFCNAPDSNRTMHFYHYIFPSSFAPKGITSISGIPQPKPSVQVKPSTQALGNTPLQYKENVKTFVSTAPNITLEQFDSILDESFTDTNYEPDNPVIFTDGPIPPITGDTPSSGSPDDDSANLLPSFTWNIGEWIYSLIRHYMPADIAQVVILGIDILMFILVVRLALNFVS